MRTAILGWGSLLWEGGQKFDQRHGSWEYDGPTLKLEFSRISQRRRGALTLVIDEQHGISTIVAWCLSTRGSLEDAVRDLRAREDTTVEKVGRVVVTPRAESAHGQTATDSILAWARLKKLDAVVWTALESNFTEKTNQPFSVDAVVSYLKSLKVEGKVKAAEYVRGAPDFVKTPVRTALQREPWF